MDYCYSCRRTLNGALVCPGCGAYAPDIAPPPSAYRGEAEPALTPAPWAPGHDQHGDPHGRHSHGGGPYRDPARGHEAAAAAASLFDEAPGVHGVESADGASDLGGDADDDPAGSDFLFGEAPEHDSVLGPASIAPTLHRGRAARRRQMERWKKNRRRAAAATAVALFGGGVTVASMQSHGGKGSSTTAADAPAAPTSIQTDNASSGTTVHDRAPSTGAPHTGSTGHRPTVRATYPSTDGVASVPSSVIPSGQPVSYTVTKRPAPSTTTAPAPTTTTPPSSTSGSGSGSTTTNSGGTSGSTASTPPSTQQSGSSGSTTTTAPSQQQGLCLLILCVS